jgi:hypothetical protein
MHFADGSIKVLEKSCGQKTWTKLGDKSWGQKTWTKKGDKRLKKYHTPAHLPSHKSARAWPAIKSKK